MSEFETERDRSRASREALRIAMYALGIEPASRVLWCTHCHEFEEISDAGECQKCGGVDLTRSIAFRERDEYRKPAVLCDLDGTLASCDWRRDYVVGEKKDWAKFFLLLGGDAPVAWLVDTLRRWDSAGAAVLLASGRPVHHETPTRWWLREHEVPYANLFMRPDGDFRPDPEVKRDIFTEHIAPHYRVLRAWDDRPQIAEVWQSFGVPVNLVTDPGLEPLLDR